MAENNTNTAAEDTTAVGATGQPRGQAMEVEWDDSQMVNSFANVINASSTREEVTFFFGANQTWNMQGSNKFKVQLNNRIVLTPYAAKRFSVLLGGIIKQYEARYGDLDITLDEADKKN